MMQIFLEKNDATEIPEHFKLRLAIQLFLPERYYGLASN